MLFVWVMDALSPLEIISSRSSYGSFPRYLDGEAAGLAAFSLLQLSLLLSIPDQGRSRNTITLIQV